MHLVSVTIIVAVWLFPTQGRQVVRLVCAATWRLALLGLAGVVLHNAFMGWGEMRVAAITASLIIAVNPAFTYALSELAPELRILMMDSGIRDVSWRLPLTMEWGRDTIVAR